MSYRYTMLPVLTDTDRNLAQYALNRPSEWIAAKTRYTRKTPSTWFATEEIVNEESFKELETLWNAKKPRNSDGKEIPFPISLPVDITANTAHALFKECNKIRELLNLSPSVLISLTAGPSKSILLNDEEYAVVFSIDDARNIEFHVKPIKQEITIELLEGETVPMPLFEGISPTLKKGKVEYNAMFKVCFLGKAAKMLLYQTNITRTNRYPDVVFDGKPQTITLPLPNGEWKDGVKVLKQGNSISIESIPNPDRKDLSLTYEFQDAGNTVKIYVNIINNFPCKRCGKTYNRAENRHGACVWHPVHGRRWHQEYEASLETLSKYAPKTAIKVNKQTIKQLIKQDPRSQLLQQINVKLAHIEQKYGVVYNLSDISTRTIGEIKVIIDNHLADSRIPYDLTRIMKRLFTIETVEQILNPFYFDFSDIATHPQSTDERNPNKHYGIHNGIWLCCGQQQQSEGCLIGWHSKTVDEPTFTHIAFNKSPLQCTEYINDPNTSTEVFYRALEAYKKGDIVGTIQLEMLQNRIYGSQLGIKFHTLDPDQKTYMMSNVLSGAKYTGVELQNLLAVEVSNTTKITKIWIMNQIAALMYPNGNGLRYITDTKYVERLVTVVKLANETKGVNGKQLLYDKLVVLFPGEKATLKPPLTALEQQTKLAIDPIVKKLDENLAQLSKNKNKLRAFKKKWETVVDKLSRGVWGDLEIQLAPDLKTITDQRLKELESLFVIDDSWVKEFEAFKRAPDYKDAQKIVDLQTLLNSNPIEALDLTKATTILSNATNDLNVYTNNRNELYLALTNAISTTYSKFETLYARMKPKYIEVENKNSPAFQKLKAETNTDAASRRLLIWLSEDKKLRSQIEAMYNAFTTKLSQLNSNYVRKNGSPLTAEFLKNTANVYDLDSNEMKQLYGYFGIIDIEPQIQNALAAFKLLEDEFKKLLIVYTGKVEKTVSIKGYIDELSEQFVRKQVENYDEENMKTFQKNQLTFFTTTINGLYASAANYIFFALEKKVNGLYEIVNVVIPGTAYSLFDSLNSLIDTWEKSYAVATNNNTIVLYDLEFTKSLEEEIDAVIKGVRIKIGEIYTKFTTLLNEVKRLDTAYTNDLPIPVVDLLTPNNTIDAYNKIVNAISTLPEILSNYQASIQSSKNDIPFNLKKLKTSPVYKQLIKESETLVSIQDYNTFLEKLAKLRMEYESKGTTTMEPVQTEEEKKRIAFRDNIYTKIMNETTPNLSFDQMQKIVIDTIMNHKVLGTIKAFIDKLDLDGITKTLSATDDQELIIGALQQLDNSSTGSNFLLYHYVRPGNITIENNKYVHEHLFELNVHEGNWEAAMATNPNFGSTFLSVVANIATLLEQLQKAAEAREEKLIGKTKFNVMFDSETVGRKYGPINSGCKAALTAAISEYDIEIANESWSNDKPIPNFKTPTFFILFQQNNVGIDAMVEALKNKSNLFFVLCTGTVKTEAFLTRTTSKVSDISATLYMVEQLNAYRRKNESSTSDKGGEEKLAEKKSLFTKFDVVFDGSTVYKPSAKDNPMNRSGNCFEALLKYIGFNHSIVINDTRREDIMKSYNIPTFFITYNVQNPSWELAAEWRKLYANIFWLNVNQIGNNWTVTEYEWLTMELKKYENDRKFDIKFSTHGIGPSSNAGGITEFKQWLKDQGLKYHENNANPSIDFDVTATDQEGTVSVTNNKIIVPYYWKTGKIASWNNYVIVEKEIPTLRTAILTLLAESTAGSPEPTPPPRSPSPQPTPPPSTEETPSEEKSDVSTGGSASTEGSSSSSSTEKIETAPKTPEEEFKGLADRLNEEIKKKRALATVLHIKRQLEKITTTNINVEPSIDPWRIPNNLEISGVTQRQEKFDQYDQYLLKRYYIWTLMLYAMETTHVSRTPDFIDKLSEYCSKNENDHSYFTLLKNSNMFIHIFELDRNFRLLSTINKYREFLNTLNMQDKNFVMDDSYTKGIENDDILKTPHYEVSYWIWQPSLFYAYGMLSKYMQIHDLSIQSDFWVVSNKDSYAGILNNITTAKADDMFEKIIEYSDDSVKSYSSEVKRVLDADKIVPEKKDTIGSRVHSAEFKSLGTKVLTTLLNITFRKEIDALFSRKDQIVYTLWNSNELHGYSILENNPLISAKKQQFEIKEIVAKTHGRALFLRMYLDTLLFAEVPNHDIWLIPKKKLTLRSDFPKNYQILQALPEKLLSTYSSWGFKRNFELQVPAVQILQDYTYLDNLDVTEFPTIKLKAIEKKTGKPVSFLPYGSDMTDIHHALYRLFGFDIDKNGKVSWLNSNMNDLIFNVFTIAPKIGLFYAGEHVDTPVKLEVAPEGLRKDELTVQLKSKQKIQIPIWNASSQTIELVPVETLQQLEAAKVQMFILPQVLEITESKVTYVETKAKKTSTRSKNIPILIDIAEIPVAYNPKWTQADALISFDEFVNNQSNLKKQVDKKRKELLETKPHLTNAEKYALILLGTENSLANRLAYLPNAINIDIQATLDFLNSLQ